MRKKPNKNKNIFQPNQALVFEVLKVFKDNNTKQLNYKQVNSRLPEPADQTELIKTLDFLAEEEKIGEAQKGKFYYLHGLNEVEGILDMTSHGYGFVVSEDSEDDIFIGPGDLNTALHGDRVAVSVYARRKGKKLEGEIVSVLQRRKTSFVGILELKNTFGFLIPDDNKMHLDILIPTDKLNGAQDGQKVIAEIYEWPEKARNPVGKITRILGEPGENDTEMHAIVAEFGFPLEFPADVEAEAEQIKFEIPAREIKNRRDFRNILTFTIDPYDAKDFDDAISFVDLGNDTYEIGVHIADVTHYIQPGSKLEEEAKERATSVYLVDRTIPMLPEKLSNGVCSLRPNEEKLTFSAVFIIDKNAQIKDQWIGKTVINSDRRFTYEEAQEVIETGQGDHAKELKILNDLAKKLKENRFKNGAINFETEEVKFRLDEKGKPLDVYVKVRKDAHKLIEEFMLLANKKVAEFVYKINEKDQKHPFVYRVHDAPNEDKISEFSKFLKRFNLSINAANQKTLASSFNDLLKEIEGKPQQNILQSMAIRTMAKAFYTSKKSGHYGLAFQYYSHFTSPIRRYPDVMAHRLLFDYLNDHKNPDIKNLEERCKHSSAMELKAADAERASIKYKQAEYLQNFIGRVFPGIISGITEWGIYVELIDNKCEGMIRLNSIFDDHYMLDEKEQAIVGKRGKRKFRLGDEVRIKIKKTDLNKRTIDFILVS